MSLTRLVVGTFIAPLLLAVGCADRVAVYESMHDLPAAQQNAALVATGEVTKVEAVQHFMGKEVESTGLGKLGTECVAQEQVTFKVDEAIKGPAEPGKTLAFLYYGACFHPAEGFQLTYKAPTLMKGDKVKVYLKQNPDGRWWLIAHKLANPTPGPGYEKTRIMIY